MGFFRKPKITLALGGGAARGLCNVGVLKVMEKHIGRENMPFDMIVGTSIGGLVGGAYCAGVSVSRLEKMAREFTLPALIDLALSETGLIKGDKLEGIITGLVGDNTFESLKIPFALTATDLQTGEELTYTTGNLVKLIRASCSWPGFFSAVPMAGRLLADGGIRNSIPTKAAYHLGATFVAAVDPGFSVKTKRIDNALQALVQSVQIMGEELNSYQAKSADIVIKPVLNDIDQSDFDKAEEIIKQGEIAAEAVIGKIMKKLRRYIKKRERYG